MYVRPVRQLTIQVSQGTAATHLRWGGKFYSVFFCSSSQNARMKESLKLVHVRQSYHKTKKTRADSTQSRAMPQSIW